MITIWSLIFDAMASKIHTSKNFIKMQEPIDVMDVVDNLQIYEVLGEDLKGLQKDITCHYFVNIKGTRVNGPASSKDDASCLASS